MFTCEAVEKAAKPSDIEALAEKLEPALARAIRDLIKDHLASVDLDLLEEALKEGRTDRILSIIGDVDPVKAAAVKDQLQNAVWAGGALAVQSPALKEARFAFQRLNPALVNWLEGYSFNLIRDIGEGARAAVRATLIETIRAGKNPIDQARQIKQAVGLTESQAKAVANYRRELETFHLKRSARAWGLGNERSKLSGVEVMPVDAKTGRPIDGIQARRLRDQRYDARLKRAMETRTPLKPEQIDKMVDRYQERMIQNRARTIARSESLRAANVGAQDAWRQAIEARKINGDLVRKRWILSPDERSCRICRGIYEAQPKRGIPLNALFENPNGLAPIATPIAHPNCFPAGTMVSASSRITAATARHFEGELVVVGTAGGQELSGTVNHPVLTDRGWVALGALNKGDSLIRCLDQQSIRFGDHEEDGPSLIEDVARAALQSGAMTTAEVPVTAEHFHGDAANGQIAVVATDRRLSANRKASSLKPVMHAFLKNALRFLSAQFARFCDLAAVLLGVHKPFACGVCGGHLSGASIRAHLSPLDGFGFARIAHRDLVANEEVGERGAADAALARELIDGRAFEVARDQILSVRRIPFSGHVFNLETVGGHYNANGFVVHNCRCSTFIRVYEAEQLAEVEKR